MVSRLPIEVESLLHRPFRFVAPWKSVPNQIMNMSDVPNLAALYAMYGGQLRQPVFDYE